MKSNAVLERLAAPHLGRPVGRPPSGGYEDVIELGMYQAASWKHPQRLLLVVVDRPDSKTGQLNLFPDYFFLVVGWKAEELDGREALEHYRPRGTFEDRIGEFQQAIRPRLSHDDFQANEALLRLSLLAFNLVSALRIEYESGAGSGFDLGRFQRDVLKAGGRVVKGSNRLLLRIARVVAPFWEELVACLSRWKLPSRFSPPRGPRRRAWVPPVRHALPAEVRRL
ncbi:MAG: transposase [Planctomycetales bacterium]